MLYLRLIHPAHWHPRRKRFVRLAFRNSSPALGGGISVVDRRCIEERGRTVCAHVSIFYIKFRAPVILWEINANILPVGSSLEEELGPEGDECHLNIRGISDAEAEEILKLNQMHNGFRDFLICERQGEPAPITAESLDVWAVAHSKSV